MAIFFTTDISSGQLDEEESKHCTKVLRLSSGQEIELIDGQGNWAIATLTDTKGKIASFDVEKTWLEAPDEHYIHIAVAPTKNIDRIEWFVEKAVEIGIHEISFPITKYTQRHRIKEERILRIAKSAAKQSRTAYLPKINFLPTFNDLITSVSQDQKYIAHLADDNLQHFKDIPAQTSYCILIGPEGDFSHPEIELAIQNNFLPITLGKKRLRTETAALTACQFLNFLNA